MASRRLTLYINSVLPVTVTHDDLVRQKLKPGKFFFTSTGGIKIAGILCLLVAVSIALAANSFCETEQAYRLLLINGFLIAIVGSMALYLVFCFGLTVKKPGLWVKIDIVSNVVLSLLTIISSVLASVECKSSGSLEGMPPPLGIAGGIILIIGCAAMFLLYRYREDEGDAKLEPKRAARKQPPRKSVFA